MCVKINALVVILPDCFYDYSRVESRVSDLHSAPHSETLYRGLTTEIYQLNNDLPLAAAGQRRVTRDSCTPGHMTPCPIPEFPCTRRDSF